MNKLALEKAVVELCGKRQWSEEDGRTVVNAWETSGESVGSFARRCGLVPQRVHWWVNRMGRRQATAPAFVPVTVRSTSAAVTVVTGGGVRVDVTELDATSAAWVATLVRTLGEVMP